MSDQDWNSMVINTLTLIKQKVNEQSLAINALLERVIKIESLISHGGI